MEEIVKQTSTAIFASVVLNSLIYFVGKVAGFSMLVIPMGSTQLTPLALRMVILASTIPMVFGSLFYSALESKISQPERAFMAVAALITLTSLAGPIGLPVDGGTKIALSVMHLISGGVAIVIFSKIMRV